MKTELFEQIKKNSPNLFEGDPGFPLAYIECDDGWFDIIDAALMTIHGHITSRNNQIQSNIEYAKDHDINDPAYPEWRKDIELLEYPQVQQIKEKFGGLRIYLSNEDDYIFGIINMAEAMAARTCEVCGAKGHLRGGSWLKTLCDEHHEEREEHRTKRLMKEKQIDMEDVWNQAIK